MDVGVTRYLKKKLPAGKSAATFSKYIAQDF
jgi:hypothetical protein